MKSALARHAPEIVFCIKTAGFVGREFHALVLHPSVRWVHVGGSGTEHLGPWDAERVTVTHSAGVLSPFLAETWLGAVLALEGGLAQGARARAWGPRRFRTLQGQRLLLVGFGAIGANVARLAGELGMVVEAIREHPERGASVPVFGPEALDARLPHADVVSLHLRLTREREGFFGRQRFARMKSGALFVNTARGKLVDERALVAALESRHLRGAYLDVFEREPLPETSPLWAMNEVLITCHSADQVEGWDLRFADRFVNQLERYRRGEALAQVATSA
ncbi:MAG: NAD(P)-dependent oxidoreductase [Myxococcota bacterium]